ncbi:hypothetical protein NC651_017084 [Populus alba x Populus x berolinensis]|nr:hypothetical protein NC651_017084 [Populus alba x Populus x berolinensis]
MEIDRDDGKLEREYEMILKRTLQSICILTLNPNTTTSIKVQIGGLVVNDDGAVSYLHVLSIRCRARTGDHGLSQIKGEIAHPI